MFVKQDYCLEERGAHARLSPPVPSGLKNAVRLPGPEEYLYTKTRAVNVCVTGISYCLEERGAHARLSAPLVPSGLKNAVRLLGSRGMLIH